MGFPHFYLREGIVYRRKIIRKNQKYLSELCHDMKILQLINDSYYLSSNTPSRLRAKP